jgi:hypothetical protein
MRIPAVAAALVLCVTACGDGTSPAATTTTAVEVPTTYVVIDTGRFEGSVDAGGTIVFEVRETAASTGETLAGGQVVVYDYEMVGLEITLDLAEAGCDGGDDQITVSRPGPFPIGTGGEVAAAGDGLRLEGTVHRTATGTIRLDLGDTCNVGPLAWTAASADR